MSKGKWIDRLRDVRILRSVAEEDIDDFEKRIFLYLEEMKNSGMFCKAQFLVEREETLYAIISVYEREWWENV